MFHENIKKLAKENTNFRKVIYTGENSQLVLMSILVGGEIGEETHSEIDQILFLVEGEGEAILNGEYSQFLEHEVVFVPAGTKHNFKNIGDEDLKIITIYAPPHHPGGTIHKTKEEADKTVEYPKAKALPADPYENM